MASFRPVNAASIIAAAHPTPLSTTTAPTELSIEPAAVPAGSYVDLDSGEDLSAAVAGAVPLPLEPLRLRIVVRSDDPCR